MVCVWFPYFSKKLKSASMSAGHCKEKKKTQVGVSFHWYIVLAILFK